MQIQTRYERDIPVLEVAGRIDPMTSPELEEALNGVLAASKYRAVLNVTRVDFISSHGLRVFLTVLKKVKTFDGDLKLCGLSADIEKVFRISGFIKLFDISSTEGEALERFGL